MDSQADHVLELLVLPHPQISFFPACLANVREADVPISQKKIWEHAARGERIFWVKQRDPSLTNPRPEDLYRIGTVCSRVEIKVGADTSLVKLAGEQRAELLDLREEDRLLWGKVRVIEASPQRDKAAESAMERVMERWAEYDELCDQAGIEISTFWRFAPGTDIRDYSQYSDVLAFNAQFRVENENLTFINAQHILEETDTFARMKLLEQFFQSETERVKADPDLPRKIEARREQLRKEEEQRKTEREERIERLRQIAEQATKIPSLPRSATSETLQLPMLPLRDMVLFPRVKAPFIVGRQTSIAAVQRALEADRQLFLAAQHNPEDDSPGADSIYRTGVIATILESMKLPDDNLKVLVQGTAMARVTEFQISDEMYSAQIEAVRAELPPEIASGIEAVAELLSESGIPINQRQALLEQFEPQSPAAWIAKCLDVLRARNPEVQT